MYKIGMETKNTIFECSRELFYEHGVKNTSVSKICEKAGVLPGTFTYYYPRKHDLLSEIYTAYMQKCVDFVDAKISGLPSAKRHLFIVMFYYMHIYRDEKTVRFHKEVLEIGSMNIWFHNTRKLISGFSGINEAAEGSETYDLCVMADNAARRELNLNFIDSPDHSEEKIRELMQKIYTINAKLFDVDPDLVRGYLEEAYLFSLVYRNEPVYLLR